MQCLTVLYLALFNIGAEVCKDLPLDNIQLELDRKIVLVYCKKPESKYVDRQTRIKIVEAIDPKTICYTVKKKVYK